MHLGLVETQVFLTVPSHQSSLHFPSVKKGGGNSLKQGVIPWVDGYPKETSAGPPTS